MSKANLDDRKQAELAIQNAMTYAESIVATLREPLLVLDKDLRVITASRSFCRSFKVTQEETEGQLVYDLGDRQWDIPKLRELLEKVLPTNTAFDDYEVDHDFKTIGRRTMLLNARRIYSEGNNTEMILLAFEDITERTRAEWNLSIRNKVSGVLLTVLDDEMYGAMLTYILEIMKSEYGIFGYIDEEGNLIVPSMTRHIWDKCQVDDKRFVFPRETWGDNTWPRAIREKRVIFSNEFSDNIPEGHLAIHRHISLPILYKDEAIGLFQVANKETDYRADDIKTLKTIADQIAPLLSARLQREREEKGRKLSEKKTEHLNRVLRAIRDVNQLITQENDLDTLIHKACDILVGTRGYHAGWIALLDDAGKAAMVADAGWGEDFTPLAERLKRGELPDCGRRLLEQPGVVVINDVYTACTDCPLSRKCNGRGAMGSRLEHDETLYGLLAVSIDTEHERSEEELDLFQELAGDIGFAFYRIELEKQREQAETEIRKLNEELEQRVVERTAQLQATNKELEAFAYSVSHDLRAPLRAVSGYSNMVIEDYGDKLDVDGRRQLEVIRESAEEMGRLIDGLLDFSRLGRTTMKHSAINMETLAKEAFAKLQGCAESASAKLIVKTLPAASGDRILLNTVFTNLLSNGVKFAKSGQPAKIEVAGISEENEHIYSVKDNGVGFDMRYVDKIFQVFQRLHSSKEFKGTGIGLAMVQRIIHRHGGRVWTEGEVNKGATVYFTLPRQKEKENEK